MNCLQVCDLESTLILIKAGNIDINKRDKDGRTPLHYSADNGHTEVVKALIAAGADVDVKDSDDCTPLFCSAENGHVDVAKVLIDAGADVNAREKDGWTSLHFSANFGKKDIVKALISAGADVDAVDTERRTPLHHSANTGHVDVVKALIAAGININAKDKYGLTPLYFGAYNDHVDVVKALIAAGADVNTNEEDGWTPLFWSVLNGNVDIVNALIAAGADINAKNMFGRTPLHYIKNCCADVIAIVKALIAAGADASQVKIDLAPPYKRVALIQYLVLYQDESELGHSDSVFYRLWNECEKEVKEMKETCLGSSCVSLFNFVTETDINKLALYTSKGKFGILKYWERKSYLKKFYMYSNDINDNYEKGRERARLLRKIQSCMIRCFCYTLPPEIIKEISECMTNDDIKNFLLMNDI